MTEEEEDEEEEEMCRDVELGLTKMKGREMEIRSPWNLTKKKKKSGGKKT
jgi:hypothetical protein